MSPYSWTLVLQKNMIFDQARHFIATCPTEHLRYYFSHRLINSSPILILVCLVSFPGTCTGIASWHPKVGRLVTRCNVFRNFNRSNPFWTLWHWTIYYKGGTGEVLDTHREPFLSLKFFEILTVIFMTAPWEVGRKLEDVQRDGEVVAKDDCSERWPAVHSVRCHGWLVLASTERREHSQYVLPLIQKFLGFLIKTLIQKNRLALIRHSYWRMCRN